MAHPNNNEERPDIILNSPVGAKPAVYKWPLTYVSKGQKIDGAEEIIETMRWVAREYCDFNHAILKLIGDLPDTKNYEKVKEVCDRYNKIMESVMRLNKGTSISPQTSSRASQGLLKHIIQQVYNYAVVEPAELNKYSAFSSETYGETSFEFMAQLIDKNQFKPRENDVFLDLGSGVGHIVLQVAASVKCKKCYGIEIADVPAGYAKLMEERFKFWMNWHGKTYTEFELFHGDFFEREYADIIRSSTFILVNNFAFKPDVDHKLKQRFLDLKDGSHILSSKPFCPKKGAKQVNERNLTDIGSLMHVEEIKPDLKKDTVSWTPKPLPYYLHILDGSRVEIYYERQKRRQGRSMDDRGKPNKRRRVGRGSDSLSDDSEDNTVYGPTTRNAWKELVNQSQNNIGSSSRTSIDSAKASNPSRNNSTDTENYDGTIEDETPAPAAKPTKSAETPSKRDKKTDSHTSADRKSTAQSNSSTAQPNKKDANSGQPAKSCLDKKRDYVIKKGSAATLQNAPPSALYSITKPPAESSNGSSAPKIPNIVIKVKPTIETKTTTGKSAANAGRTSAPSASETPSAEPSEPKPNDENDKKLRQRRKSTITQVSGDTTSATTTKPAGSTRLESKASASNSTAVTATNGVRSKRSASKLSAKTAIAPKKKAASPDKTSSLNLLHAKTVESVASSAGYFPQPAPGCEDFTLRSIVDTPSLPRVVIKDLSMFVASFLGGKSLEKFTNDTKQDFGKFAAKIEQPHAKESLLRGIEHERTRKRELLKAEDELTRHIKVLNDRIPKLMKVHCDEFGIKNNQRSLVLHLGALLKKHQDLSAYSLELESNFHASQRPYNPPAAHSNSNQSLPSPYRVATSSATLDLSLKPVTS